jgi:hypothetical protein
MGKKELVVQPGHTNWLSPSLGRPMLKRVAGRGHLWRQWSLRTLCLLVLGVAAICAVFGERVRHGERQRYVLAEVERLGDAAHDVRVSGEAPASIRFNGSNRSVWHASYMERLLEVDLWSDEVPDKLLAEIGGLPDVRKLTVTPPVQRSPAMQRLMRARPELKVNVSWSPRHVPFREVTSPNELREATATGNAVLFTDGGWNGTFALARPLLAEFHEAWTADPSSPHVTWLRADLSECFKPPADAFRAWLVEVGLSPGGMKQMGAGWIIWLQDGAVRDATWCFQVTSKEELNERSRRAFAKR